MKYDITFACSIAKMDNRWFSFREAIKNGYNHLYWSSTPGIQTADTIIYVRTTKDFLDKHLEFKIFLLEKKQ